MTDPEILRGDLSLRNDYTRVIEALDHLEPIEQFVEIVQRIEAAS